MVVKNASEVQVGDQLVWANGKTLGRVAEVRGAGRIVTDVAGPFGIIFPAIFQGLVEDAEALSIHREEPLPEPVTLYVDVEGVEFQGVLRGVIPQCGTALLAPFAGHNCKLTVEAVTPIRKVTG